MKRLFTILTTLALLCVVGCEEQGDDNVNPNDKPNAEQPEDKPENIFCGLNKDSGYISPEGGSIDVIVYSNYKWEISGKSDWCTPSVTSGEANEDGQKVTFSADVAYDTREAIFWFRCADKQIKFIVSQDLKEVIVADENNTFNVPSEGGVVEIAYQTNVECEIIIPEEAKSWISLTPSETRGLVSESATLTVAENTTYSARSAVVKVVKVGDNSLFAEYTINQVQNDAVIADENNTINLSGCAQSINIAYKTNVECEVVIPAESQSWISLAPATRALVDESATLNIAENNTGAERSAVVKVVATNNNELVAEYTITQNQRYFMEYTSEDGFTVSPYIDATIIRNEYIDGKGYIDFDAPITSIGGSAFSGRTSLTSIIIPDSVTEIGDFAFYGCTSLTSVTIPDSVTSIGDYAFDGCLSLASVTIPDSVTSIGIYTFYKCTSLTSITIPDSVTTIGDYAFRDCNSLTSVTIGNGVTSIGGSAFWNCTSLTSVTIGNGVTSIGGCAFDDCTSLTSIIIPDSVTEIGGYAFRGCTSLTSVTIGNGVTEIGRRAFLFCDSLTSITIPDSVTSIGSEAFSGCTGELIINSKSLVEKDYTSSNYPNISSSWLYGSKFSSLVIGDNVTKIGDYAFRDCNSLTSVTIGNGVTSIGGSAFWNCTSLTSVTIGNGVTSIGGCAFDDCTSLTSIIIPDSVTEIGGYAFRGCTSLTSVTIGNGVTEIGRRAFYGCTSLTSVHITDIAAWCGISFSDGYDANPLYYANNLYLNGELVTDLVIPDSVTSIGGSAFWNCTSLTSITIPDSVTSIKERAFDGCTSLTSITIPDSVTKIGDYAFLFCDSLTSITIPDSVTSIGDYAFRYCTSLASITIPNSVTKIGYYAFRDCNSLTSVTIGNGVTSIGNSAFYDCTSLTSVYCKAVTPPTGGSGMFSGNASGRKIYVPTESVDAYKKALYWSDYASYIYGYDFE